MFKPARDDPPAACCFATPDSSGTGQPLTFTATGGGADRPGARTLDRVRWFWWSISLILIFALILPDPARAGAAVGYAINALIIFFQSMAQAATSSGV